MKHLLFVIITLCVVMPLSTAGPASAQQDQRQEWPKLDSTLMATKEYGVWYFLCEAPEFQCRTANYYLTFAPPPPYCPPPVICPPPVPCQPPVVCAPPIACARIPQYRSARRR